MSVSKPFERFERIARPPGKAKTAVTQFGRQPVLGSNEQIIGVKEQVPQGGCGRCPKNTLWTSELRTSFKRSVRPDP
jgi:hypothetical protein